MDTIRSSRQAPEPPVLFEDDELELLGDTDFLFDEDDFDDYALDRDELEQDFGRPLSSGSCLPGAE